jgi:DNA-binding beta-propeller fold protein YncE
MCCHRQPRRPRALCLSALLLLLSLLAPSRPAGVRAEGDVPDKLLFEIGAQSAPEDTYFATGAAVAPDGTVYVADSGNYRIQRFSAAGQYLGQWGSHGSGAGQFECAYGVAVAPGGTVYVTDSSNARVQFFSAAG